MGQRAQQDCSGVGITVTNRQRRVRFDVSWLRCFAAVALKRCRAESGDGQFALEMIDQVEVAIVTDPTIARVHQQFMAIPGPTDVITFPYGEIVISADTASARAPDYRHTVEEELALYTVHGLLHLNGFEDASAPGAARMRKAQSRIVKRCLAEIRHP